MGEKKIEAVKDWSEPQAVRDIQLFLGFANFYKRFIRNFSRIAALFISMLRTTNESTGDETQSTQAENQDIPSPVGGAGGGGFGRSFEKLSTAIKSAKSKKSNLTKPKKSDLPKANFARVNSGTDFLTSEEKKAFIRLQKAFTEVSIFRHFDLERHIRVETDASGYAIGGFLSQMTSDQHSSDHVTHKEPISSKSEIGQWHPVAFFFQKMIPAETRYETHD